MGRKRPLGGVNFVSDDHRNGSDFGEHSYDGVADERSFAFRPEINSLSDNDESGSSDDDFGNNNLYRELVKQQAAVEKLKEKFKASLKNDAKRAKCGEYSKDAFTRYSTTNFTNVISALSDCQKQVIKEYGFESLLMFDKCFVPNKFAKWIARQVDWKSGDMILKGKVISLTKESVHLILGLPVGGFPFSTLGPPRRSEFLSKFNKVTMPQVSFFADKIIYGESLSDEDLVTCFLIVALNSFLCSNSSLYPSTSYISIVDDVSKAKEYDWCQFVLDWLLHAIKDFTKEKAKKGTHSKTLGGCLFYLAVQYLDCVDFGPRQVLGGIPRIGVWKCDMITNYSELDKICVGTYGYRPLLDMNRTCFAKHALNLQKPISSLSSSVDFMSKIDSSFGCKLPCQLKLDICKLIEHFCCQSSMPVQIDFSLIGLLPDDLRTPFMMLLKHVCNIDSMAQDLVLDLLKILHGSSDISTANVHVSGNCDAPSDEMEPSPTDHFGNAVGVNEEAAQRPTTIIAHIPDKVAKHNVSGVNNSGSTPCVEQAPPSNNNTPNENCPPPSINPTKDGLPNAYKYHTPGNSGNPLSIEHNRCGPDVLFKKTKSRAAIAANHKTTTAIASVRDPQCDLSNIDGFTPPNDNNNAPSTVERSAKSDTLCLDDNDFVPVSSSPTPKSTVPRFCSQKGQLLMQNAYSTPSSSDRITPNLHSNHRNASAAGPSITQNNLSPEVQLIGEMSFAEKVRIMTKKSEAVYNNNMNIPVSSYSTPVSSKNQLSQRASGTADNPESVDDDSGFKFRETYSGGVVPQHGPRRVVYPGPLLRGDYEISKTKFQVNSAQVRNYEAICSLSSSEFSNEIAVDIGRVRCTFWSLGDALKPNGHVNNFVVSVFCRHLFLKPDGHPDVSKIHYFFPTISENLLNDPEDADYDLLRNSFTRASTARPLHRSNLLFFPTCFQNHWFVFVVDIKDSKFVFLDSLFRPVDEFQQYVKDRLIPSFQLVWDRCVGVDMKFHEYGVVYPHVPHQGRENMCDSGVYALMCLQCWKSPRTLLASIFKSGDIKNIRIMIANELMFNHRNTANKDLVAAYRSKGAGNV